MKVERRELADKIAAEMLNGNRYAAQFYNLSLQVNAILMTIENRDGLVIGAEEKVEK